MAKLETGSPRGKEELILGPCRRLMCPQQQGSGETEPDLSQDWACRPKDDHGKDVVYPLQKRRLGKAALSAAGLMSEDPSGSGRLHYHIYLNY